MDALHVGNFSAPVGAAAARLARAATLAQAHDELTAQRSPWLHIDRRVDRFVGHVMIRCLGTGAFEYPRDLLRRPARTQVFADHCEQGRVTQLACHPRRAPAGPGAPLRRLRAIASGSPGTPHFTADRAGRPFQRSGHRALALTRFQSSLDLDAFIQIKLVIGSHRKSLSHSCRGVLHLEFETAPQSKSQDISGKPFSPRETVPAGG